MATLNTTPEGFDDIFYRPVEVGYPTPKLDPEYFEAVLEREDAFEGHYCG